MLQVTERVHQARDGIAALRPSWCEYGASGAMAALPPLRPLTATRRRAEVLVRWVRR